ncbi:hypothetical protein [Bacillus sp. S/N-304-OC-R1]|uniref:hypothetical protein n=1 Tax=Bacillus sp. S/N-304-OC-R1 TaxID=2758034 RepID=UPI001C8E3DE6|nr:hypothetical protein [Bacillus sp. S/N-304-OC-R1]MBY0123001.1 hypothetical protein [Bacillus sp. S/N-304-OC-R1]
MILMAVTTIGFVISLGIVGVLLHFFTNEALNLEDSTSIDSVPKNEVTGESDCEN